MKLQGVDFHKQDSKLGNLVLVVDYNILTVLEILDVFILDRLQLD
jgi:hypothetical protein